MPNYQMRADDAGKPQPLNERGEDVIVIACAHHMNLNADPTSMEEQPTFLLRFPCFAIENATGTGPVVQTFNRGCVAMVLLSDEDLLNRYRAEHGVRGSTIQFNDKGHLVVYLSTLPPAITSVAFDPRRHSAVVSPVETVIEECCESVDQT